MNNEKVSGRRFTFQKHVSETCIRNMYGTELDLRKMESFIFMGYNVSPHVNAV